MRPHQTPATSKTTSPKPRIALLAIRLLLFVVVFALVEGVSSLLLFFYDFSVRPDRPIAEQRYTEYDPLLGWINRPNVHIPNMFGPNVYLKTNSQRIRADSDFDQSIPDGKIRIICSGDSFTMGYGVSNKETWCRLLTQMNRRIETINMGQGGYGVDQAYLWYKRDASRFQHNIHLFTVITYDFDRMRQNTFARYGKPILRAENQKLITDNVPVPRTSRVGSWFFPRMNRLRQLRTFQLVNRAYLKFSPAEMPDDDAQLEEVVKLVIEDLIRINAERGSRLVVVFLPAEDDHLYGEQLRWRRFLGNLCQNSGVVFLDLCEDFYRLPISTVRRMFIRRGVIDYAGAAGHYTPYGNRLTAKLLLEQLSPLLDAAPNITAD